MSHSQSLRDLQTQMAEGVVGLTGTKDRLNALLDWVQANVSDRRKLPILVSQLASEVDGLCGQTQKCVSLYADLERLHDELNNRQKSLNRQLQTYSGVEDCIRKLDDHNVKLDGIKAIDANLDDYRKQVEDGFSAFDRKLDDHDVKLDGIKAIDANLDDYRKRVDGKFSAFDKELDGHTR